MNAKVYVDNLAGATTEIELTDLFSTYGNVVNVNIALDHTTNKPRGYGFVTMATSDGAQAAIQALNGKALATGTLIVSKAWPGEERSDSPNGRRQPRRGASCLF